MRNQLVSLTAAAVFLSGCLSPRVSPDVAQLYNMAAQVHESERNPVIVIPGILGSQLREAATGQVVWGAFDADSADPETAAGARLIALPMMEHTPLNHLETGAVPAGVLDRVRLSLLGVPVELQAYAAILQTLGAGGFRDQSLAASGALDYGDAHFTCFQFAYDWRRDISFNAVKLHEFMEEKKKYVEAELLSRYGVKRDVKFDIVAHSMGGLLARYYLQYGIARLSDDGSVPALSWEGKKMVQNLILVGTPNAGSILSFKQLINGADYGPFVPSYSAALLGTMPAVYELLPRTRQGAYRTASGEPLDVFDAKLWIKNGWGLANPDLEEDLELLLPEVTDAAARRRIALDHLAKSLARAKQFQEALDRPVQIPSDVSLSIFAGDAIPTLSTATVAADGTVEFGDAVPGDGTVTRKSVLLDERTPQNWSPTLKSPVRWSSVTFLFTDHIGMTMDPAFSDNVLFRLLERGA